ncbi:MAG: hypothetical protein U5P41_12955 [Gammaproteobacteria bacterium]|nr:hypothetical protein [Gammaproteobacteria bacterium]
MAMTRCLAITLLCLLASGCFDIKQSFTVDNSNQARYTMEFHIDARIVEFADTPNEDICRDIDLDASEALKKTTNKKRSHGDIICKVTLEGPIEEFDNFSLTQDNNRTILIEKVDDSTYKISSDFSTLSDKDNEAPDEFSANMAKAMFGGRVVSWKVSAPVIVRTNGQISDDGRHVTWEIALSDIFNQTGTDHQFHAVIKVQPSWSDWFKDSWYWLLSFVYSEEDIQANKAGFENAEAQKAYNRKQAEIREREQEAREKERQAAERKRRKISELMDQAEAHQDNNEFAQAIETYKQVLEIDSQHNRAFNELAETKSEEHEHEDKLDYINNKLKLYDVTARYYKTYLDDRVPGVVFEIKNAGDKTLNKVEVTVYFKVFTGQYHCGRGLSSRLNY